MFWTLSDAGMNIDVVDPSSSYLDDQNLVFASPDEAARLLERYAICWENYSAIQEAIVSMGETPQGLSHQELAAQLARLVVSGRLNIRRSLPLDDSFFRGPGGLKLGVWTPRRSLSY